MATVKKSPSWIPANAVLTTMLSGLVPPQRWNEYRVWEVWEAVVGEALARKACPSSIHNGTLFVMVSHPVLIQQMQFTKATLRDRLNQQLGGQVVRDIRFVIGRVSERALRQGPPAQRPLPAYTEMTLPPLGRPDLEAAFQRLIEARRKRLLQKGERDGAVTDREPSKTM
jgi:Dna[CI] antecedent, DciA